MTKFRTVLKQGDGGEGNKEGYRYEVRFPDGTLITAGWTLGGKRDARQEAKRALEEMGLLTDGVRNLRLA